MSLNLVVIQLDRDGEKGREDGERGGEGRLFERGDYFKFFRKRGAIIRGRGSIEGRPLFEEIW